MPNQEYPTVNGIASSWNDIKISMTPEGGSILDMVDIAGIKTDVKTEVGEQRGASGGRVLARTTGSVTYECSLTLYRSGLRKLQKALMENAPTRGNQRLISLVPFDIMIQHTPPGEAEIYERKVKGARYLGTSGDFKEGNDADQAEVTLSVIEIVDIINGQEVLPI